jgi:hypothetical protein
MQELSCILLKLNHRTRPGRKARGKDRRGVEEMGSREEREWRSGGVREWRKKRNTC